MLMWVFLCRKIFEGCPAGESNLQNNVFWSKTGTFLLIYLVHLFESVVSRIELTQWTK